MITWRANAIFEKEPSVFNARGSVLGRRSECNACRLPGQELEKLASRKLRINAKETMKIAEKLYTQGKSTLIDRLQSRGSECVLIWNPYNDKHCWRFWVGGMICKNDMCEPCIGNAPYWLLTTKNPKSGPKFSFVIIAWRNWRDDLHRTRWTTEITLVFQKWMPRKAWSTK